MRRRVRPSVPLRYAAFIFGRRGWCQGGAGGVGAASACAKATLATQEYAFQAIVRAQGITNQREPRER